MKACSPIVARHTGAAQDCEYEAAWANTYRVGIQYTATAAKTSTTSATTLAVLSFNGLDGVAPTGRGLLCDARRGFAFVVDCGQANEFALAHWLVKSVVRTSTT